MGDYGTKLMREIWGNDDITKGFNENDNENFRLEKEEKEQKEKTRKDFGGFKVNKQASKRAYWTLVKQAN